MKVVPKELYLSENWRCWVPHLGTFLSWLLVSGITGFFPKSPQTSLPIYTKTEPGGVVQLSCLSDTEVSFGKVSRSITFIHSESWEKNVVVSRSMMRWEDFPNVVTHRSEWAKTRAHSLTAAWRTQRSSLSISNLMSKSLQKHVAVS